MRMEQRGKRREHGYMRSDFDTAMAGSGFTHGVEMRGLLDHRAVFICAEEDTVWQFAIL